MPQRPMLVLVGACTWVSLSPSRTQRSIIALVGSLTRAAKSSPNWVLDNSTFNLTKLQHEIQNEYRGVGDITQSSPARLRDDRFINHTLDKEYAEPPHIILTNMCNAHLFIDNAKTDKGQVTITIGIGAQFEGEEAKYQILAIAKDTP